jgi:hypothetical protein
MECAGLIGRRRPVDAYFLDRSLSAMAVGRNIFRADANTLIELLIKIQSSSSTVSASLDLKLIMYHT